jgi:hypothetical protein
MKIKNKINQDKDKKQKIIAIKKWRLKYYKWKIKGGWNWKKF